jgi:hypothetical protein
MPLTVQPNLGAEHEYTVCSEDGLVVFLLAQASLQLRRSQTSDCILTRAYRTS